MTISPVILWTDALLWLLVLAGAFGAIKAYRHPPSRARWRKVAQRPLAMASATLLILFLLIGLADSIHFRNREASGHLSVTVFSLLDVALSDLRNRTERTYSAPLALTSFSKETVQGADGRQTRVAPPLKWAGNHLGSATDQARDLVTLAVVGAAKGAAVWGGMAFLLVVLLARQQRAKPFVLWRRIWRDRQGVAWWSVLSTLGVIAIVAGPALEWGSHYHLLGTDKVGQDVLYQSLKAVRTALVIGCVTTLATIPLAIGMGLSAGFFRGWVDDVVQYIYTVLNSIPGVLLIAAAVLSMQVLIDRHPEWFATATERADLRLLALCLILGMTSWTGLARLLRGETLKLSQLEYVQAARCFGVSAPKILLRHILPNVMHIVLIALVMDFSALVLAEAVLSYIGIGVDPTMISFGTMINAARLELSREPIVWWLLVSAFSFMLVLVLAANLLADAVRDAFDPHYGGSA